MDTESNKTKLIIPAVTGETRQNVHCTPQWDDRLMLSNLQTQFPNRCLFYKGSVSLRSMTEVASKCHFFARGLLTAEDHFRGLADFKYS